MNKFIIPITRGKQTLNFEVLDFAYNENHQSKFELLLEVKFVASFEPDRLGFLHICKNPGSIDPALLHEIAEKIESRNFH